MDNPTVDTIDLYTMPTEKARTLSKRMFYGGFCLLPWLWFANIWLFWPEFRHGPDSEVKKYTRWSAIGFAVMTLLLLPWTLTYYIGGPELLGDTWYKLDAAQIPLASYGL